MSTLVKFKTWVCTDCGDDYQGAFAYINLAGKISCHSCLDLYFPEAGA